MSLGWRGNGEEVEELSAGLCSSMQLLEHPQGAEVARDRLTGFLGNAHGVSTRLYHISLSPPQHPMTALQKHHAPVSLCSYVLGTAPHCPAITPTSGSPSITRLTSVLESSREQCPGAPGQESQEAGLHLSVCMEVLPWLPILIP